MPHKCVRCSELYGDDDSIILKGCPCGARLFFFVKKEALTKVNEVSDTLSDSQKVQIENEVLEIVGNPNEPVVLDFESVNILEPGKYEIDLVQLLSKSPIIYKLEDGKYRIDLAT